MSGHRFAGDDPLPRRRFLRSVVAAAAVAMAGPPAVAASPNPAASPHPEPSQPTTPSRRAFAARAAEMRRVSIARGDQAFGAVVVKDGRIVGEGISAVITDNDPTAHAEMQAIRDAARRLRSRDLSGCELYGTSRACPMCEAAAVWARVSRLFYGEEPTDAGAPRFR